MSDQQTRALCPVCGQPVDPREPGVQYAVEKLRFPVMGGYQYSDGMGAYFHKNCQVPSTYRVIDR